LVKEIALDAVLIAALLKSGWITNWCSATNFNR